MSQEAKGSFAVAGLTYRTAPLIVREAMAIPKDLLQEVLRLLKGLMGVEEIAVLSTCNRFEVFFSAPPERLEEAARELKAWMARRTGMDDVDQMTYLREGVEAFHHTVRVGAGLDSLVVGEAQIFGQLKDAYRIAAEARQTGEVMRRAFNKIFSHVKRIRHETEIGRGSVSVASVAVELAEKMFGTLEGRRVALLGSGKIAELTARALALKGVTEVTVVNRTFETAQELAQKQGGTAQPWAQLGEVLAETDVAIVSTGAPHYVVEPAHLEARRRRHPGAPIFFIDLSLPRNVDPAVHQGEGVFLYTLEDFEGVAQANAAKRSTQALRAEEMAKRLTRPLLDRERPLRWSLGEALPWGVYAGEG